MADDLTARICSVSGCGRHVKAKRLCAAHYDRTRRGNDLFVPVGPPRRPDRVLAFIEEATQYQGEDCLIWPYTWTGQGYGTAKINQKQHRAHRLVCERTHGPCPKGRVAAHACGNNACVNPRHLRWATQKENMADAIGHGKTNRGSKAWSVRLTASSVLAIRSQSHRSQKELAAEYGVSQRTISLVLNRKNWAWL